MESTSWFLFITVTLTPAVICLQKKTNVVIFIADDLGIGDVGCFGNTTVRTPNIDGIAREGVKLNHHLAASSFCTPSRAALLTGRYPIRSGMAPDARGLLNVFLFLAQSGGLPTNETTIAELAKSQGYKTALIGKWHLGLHKNRYGDNLHSPMNQGFDQFFGIPLTNMKDFSEEGLTSTDSKFPMFNSALLMTSYCILLPIYLLFHHDFIKSRLVVIILTLLVVTPIFASYWFMNNFKIMNSILMRNNDVIEQPIILQNLTHRFVDEGVRFIHTRADNNEPFLLVMSWQLVHTHLVTHPDFTRTSAHGRYGDGIHEMDWGTGEILKALDRNGVKDNTFVYFTSDNGGHLEERGANGERDGGSNGIYKGGKTHGAVDGGIRVPTVARWPGHIPPNSVTNEPTMFMDVLPTVANIMDAEIPKDRTIDGKDIMPLLSGKQKQPISRFLAHYCGNEIHAVRYRPKTGNNVWKLNFYTPWYIEGTEQCLFTCSCKNAIKLDPPGLHDMTSDPGEKKPLDYASNAELSSLVEVILENKRLHEESIQTVPHQFSRSNLMWRPYLQPCCGGTFPFCSCKEKSVNSQVIS